MISAPVTKFLFGYFKCEASLLHATRQVRKGGFEVHDVFTPYPVHGLDDAMGMRRSRLPKATFIFGLLGFLVALLFQEWVSVVSWPMNIGGKPNNSWPAFIPVMFELTVLFAGVLSFIAFLWKSRLLPGLESKFKIPPVSNDSFVMAFSMEQASFDLGKISSILNTHGATEIREEEVQL